MKMKSKPQLTSLQGRLIDAYPQFQPETILHSYEITNERRDNEKLRSQWHWTADFPMYNVEDGKPILYFAPRPHNLVFRNLEEAIKQLIDNQNYKPKPEEAAEVVESAKKRETLRLNLLDLELEKDNEEWSHFTIDTENYKELNKHQKAFAQRVYAKGKDFPRNMRMLKKVGIGNTRIYVLNPDYVMEHAKDNAIARASRLDVFGGNSSFGADGRIVDIGSICLRGVLKVAEGDDAQKAQESNLEDRLLSILRNKSLAEGDKIKEINKLYRRMNTKE